VIRAVIGPNGAGKTAYALRFALALAKKHGVPVYTNVAGVPGTVFLDGTDFTQLRGLRHCVVVLDEILAAFDSRAAMSLPRPLRLWVTTLRHSDVVLLWTSPTFERADVMLREVTTSAIACVPFIVGKAKGRLWPRTRTTRYARLRVVEGELGRPGLFSWRLGRTVAKGQTFDTFHDFVGLGGEA